MGGRVGSRWFEFCYSDIGIGSKKGKVFAGSMPQALRPTALDKPILGSIPAASLLSP